MMDNIRDEIQYPESFKQRVKEEYPDADLLHRLVEMGAIADVRKYLLKITPKGVSAEFILSASSLEEIREEALRILRKKSLYTEWENIYNDFLGRKKSHTF